MFISKDAPMFWSEFLHSDGRKFLNFRIKTKFKNLISNYKKTPSKGENILHSRISIEFIYIVVVVWWQQEKKRQGSQGRNRRKIWYEAPGKIKDEKEI